jgi:cell division transport system permease protein
MFISFFRAIKFGFQQFKRNLWLSIVTIILLVLPLLIVNLVLSLGAIAKATTASLHNKIEISVYFKAGVDNEQAQAFREELLKIPQIKDIELITREGELERFRQRHANDPAILESLNELGENPFTASLVIKANKIEDYPYIMQILEQPAYNEFIEKKNFDDYRQTISQINNLMKNIGKFGFGVAAIFCLIAILIVINSIRVAIYSHRDEIGIMRLVGASGGFIRGPFLIEAVIFSFLAMLITLLILYPGLNFVQPYLNNLFEDIEINLVQYFNNNFLLIFGSEFLGILILSILSTTFALRKYLKI